MDVAYQRFRQGKARRCRLSQRCPSPIMAAYGLVVNDFCPGRNDAVEEDHLDVEDGQKAPFDSRRVMGKAKAKFLLPILLFKITEGP